MKKLNLYEEYLKTYKLTPENSDGFFDLVGKLIETDEVQSLKEFEQHLEIDRLQHILGVSYLTYKICKKLGWDYEEATRAAVMHDLVYYDWRDGTTGAWHKGHGYKHPIYAAMNAKELCPELTVKEENMIRCHMWPFTVVPPKFKEGYIVLFSDKYCATREIFYSLSKKYKEKFLDDVKRI